METRTLERVKYAIRQELNEELFRDANITVERVAEFAGDRIRAQVNLDLAEEPIATTTAHMSYNVPASWWQMFKQDVLKRPCRIVEHRKAVEVKLMAGAPVALLGLTGSGPIRYYVRKGGWEDE